MVTNKRRWTQKKGGVWGWSTTKLVSYTCSMGVSRPTCSTNIAVKVDLGDAQNSPGRAIPAIQQQQLVVNSARLESEDKTNPENA